MLTFELLGLPTPGSTFMAYCGFLVFGGKLDYYTCIIVASSGTIMGISIAYFLGIKYGDSIFSKYGHYIHLEPKRIEKIGGMFTRYGNGFIAFSYFVMGARHFTGYFLGIAKMPFIKFALNTYIGAIIWTSAFISLGRFLGYSWNLIDFYMQKYALPAVLIIVLLCIILFFIYKKFIHKKEKSL